VNAPNENTHLTVDVENRSHIFTVGESKKITEALCAWIDEEGEDLEYYEGEDSEDYEGEASK
jgi:hypothetical protein